MKRTWIAACVLALSCALPSAFAIDRAAKSVDAVWIEGASYKDLSIVEGAVTVENLLAPKNEDWAILARLSYGQYDADPGGSTTTWLAGLGIKYYLTPVTGLALMGTYRSFNGGDHITAGTASIKQRIFPSTWAVSPFVDGSASLQSATLSRGFIVDQDESFNEAVFTVGGGIDFLALDEFAFVFKGGFSQSSAMDGGEQYADGFYFGLGMQYYWY